MGIVFPPEVDAAQSPYVMGRFQHEAVSMTWLYIDEATKRGNKEKHIKTSFSSHY